MSISKTIEQIVTEHILNSRDPVFDLTFGELGITPVVVLDGVNLCIQLISGFPIRFLQDLWRDGLQTTLQRLCPQYRVTLAFDVFINAHQPQAQWLGKGLRGVKNTIAIASGKGGVGKSTVTVNIAIALARAGARVGILDADIYGPSIPLMLGKAKPVQPLGDRYLPVMAHGVQAMSMAYLAQHEQPLIWRGPMLAKSMLQMLDMTQWDDLDYLLIDLPPGTGDIPLTLVQKIPLTAAIVVTTPQQVATLDAKKALTMFERTGIFVLGVVENMALHTCSHCGHEERLFGEGGAQALCEAHRALLLGQLPFDSRVALECDSGVPTVATGTDALAMAFIRVAQRAAIALSQRPLNRAPASSSMIVE